MVLLVTEDEVRSALTVTEAIASVENSFREYSLGRAQIPARITVRIPESNGWVGVMSGYMSGVGALATKVVTSYPDNVKLGYPTITGILLYSNPETGLPLAIMEASYLTSMRTGAVGAVASKYLARKDAESLGIIGTGAQARAQLEAICKVREIKEVRAYSPTVEHRLRFAEEMSRRLGVNVVPVEDARDAVKKADIVVTATSSKTPVLNGEWVGEGTHINGIGSHAPQHRELDDETMRKSKIVVDSKEAALREAGDLLIPIANGLISESEIHAELGEVIVGSKKGRESESEVTLFKSVGLAIQDVAVAKVVFDRANEMGLGKEVQLSQSLLHLQS